MRKILLGAFALFAAVAVNAQEIGQADSQEFQDIIDMGGAVESTCLLHEGEYVTWSVGNDTWKTGSSYHLLINGEGDEEQGYYKLDGTTGSNNVVMATTSEGVGQGAPTSGAFCIYDVKADGYLYIFAKMATNKNWLVWEEGTRIPYYWGCADENTGVVYNYNLYDNYDNCLVYDADVDGYYINDSYKIETASYYLVLANQSADTDAANAISVQAAVIKFPVYANCQYIFCGQGTKPTVGGYYFDTTGDATISYLWGDDATELVLCDETSVVGNDAAGISNITVAPTTENGAIYNLAGQRVSSANHGMFIVNGQKILVK